MTDTRKSKHIGTGIIFATSVRPDETLAKRMTGPFAQMKLLLIKEWIAGYDPVKKRIF